MLNKLQAIYAMNYGARVRHRSFTSDEWMTSENGIIVFEDGIKCKPDEFWSNRKGDEWNDGWEILSPENEVEAVKEVLEAKAKLDELRNCARQFMSALDNVVELEFYETEDFNAYTLAEKSLKELL